MTGLLVSLAAFAAPPKKAAKPKKPAPSPQVGAPLAAPRRTTAPPRTAPNAQRPTPNTSLARSAAPPAKVDYDHDVRPILSENCFACHGFDAKTRQAGLRLDTPEGARQKMPSGKSAVVPGKPGESNLLLRALMKGPLHMPPASTHKTLTPAQIALLRRWIKEGGKYAPHWSFVAPQRPALPPVKNAKWARNPIDRFILARLEKEKLKPSPEADRATLLRRLSFDLTGLPPTVKEIEAFLADRSPNAYEKQVDRLLASPRYGERMALPWLDMARYADTHGYHIDSHRDMWRWREWVIEAFNSNKPFDRFAVEQIAGDLLPNSTRAQKIATGFNRNHPINFEGGAIPEEYQVAYVIDRVDTTATTFLGLTMKCAQCHDHKFDPLTSKDYYRFYAYFNNIAEQGLDGQKGNAAPFIKAPSPEQETQLAEFAQEVARAEGAVKARIAEMAPAQAEWEKQAQTQLENTPAVTTGLAAHIGLDETEGAQAKDSAGKLPVGAIKGKVERKAGKFGQALSFDGGSYVEFGDAFGFDRADKVSYGAWVFPTTNEHMAVLSRMDQDNGARGWDLYLADGKAYAHLIHKWEDNAIRVNAKTAIALNQWHHLFVTYDGSGKAKGLKLYVDGKSAELDITHDKLTDTIKTDKPLAIGRRTAGANFKGLIDEARLYERELTAAEVEQLAKHDTLRSLLAAAPEKRTPEQKEAVTRHFLETTDAPYRKLSAELADWKKKHSELDQAIPTTMVMQEITDKPRETFMLIRGQYDKHGDKVTPGTPGILLPLPQDAPANRLGLANWLVDPKNPLTARVAVNRFWQMIFGVGIVKTAEDFGTQGERPSHPELLDWLATEFIRTGWDVKEMMKRIVTSAAYRQSSDATPALMERDPENRLLARAPRNRLPAEFVRDQALFVSGLLVPKLGGPSVKPYHPAGLWEEIAFGGEFTAQKYVQDHGEALYRRSMYTFWKRTCPPPSLLTFDAPEREFCIARRTTTNTPLQALVLMNDPTYVEAARKFAERILTEAPAGTPLARVQWAFRAAILRRPTDAEAKALLNAYNQQVLAFRKDTEAAKKLLSVGESPRNEKLDPAELATWAFVANMIFNLDEMMTKG